MLLGRLRDSTATLALKSRVHEGTHEERFLNCIASAKNQVFKPVMITVDASKTREQVQHVGWFGIPK